MKSREYKRLQIKYGSFLEPFAILLLLMLYLIPVVAVINLSPRVRQSYEEGKSVLGIRDAGTLSLTSINGIHSVITNEDFYQQLPHRYVYSAKLSVRDAGKYSKPILRISNATSSPQTIEFVASKESSSASEIGIIFDDVNYILLESSGNVVFRSLEVAPNSEITIYLTVSNASRANFSEYVALEVNIPTNSVEQSDQ